VLLRGADMVDALNDSPETQHHLDVLRLCFNGIMSPFMVVGTAHVGEPPVLHFADGATQSTQWPVGNVPNSLIERCLQSDRDEGLVTNKSAEAREVYKLRKSDQWTLNGFDPETSGVLERVARALCPNSNEPLRAELIAVEIHVAGTSRMQSEEASHRGETLGTLVVVCPVMFYGGTLTLSHRGAAMPFEASGSWGSDASLRWVAFVSGVGDDVESVSWGARVTLRYQLHHDHASARVSHVPLSRTDGIALALKNAVTDPAFLPSGGSVGFSCSTLYTATSGFATASQAITEETSQLLKGNDLNVFSAASQCGLRTRLVPYITDGIEDQRWQLSRFFTDRELATFKKRPVVADHFAKAFPLESNPAHECTHWMLPFQSDTTSRTHVATLDIDDMEIFLRTALLVEIPAVRDRSLPSDATPSHPVEVPTQDAVPESAAQTAPPPESLKNEASVVQNTPDTHREYMTSELRDLGLSSVDIKKMVARGELVRTGFGWYRYASAKSS
jgi:hypothetical protein